MSKMPENILFKNFINGEFCASQAAEWIDNYSPATGLVYSQIARSHSADVERAYLAASKAFSSFKKTTFQQRASYLRKMADILETRIDSFAAAESRDQGKPMALAKNMDMRRCIENFRFFADFISQEFAPEKNEILTKDSYQSEVLRKPVGVVGLISPWNLPLYLLTWKIAPALACGNTVICKPSEFTSVTAVMLAEVANEAGLPPGVLNIVLGYGHEVGEAMVQHPGISAISFTGGTQTGQRIYEQSAKNFKKISLELGGKNPNIIFADADLEKAVATSLRSSFLNQGEICLCGSRIYVEKKILPAFLERFIAATAELRVGDPESIRTFMGALISQAHREKVQNYIELAKKEGGRILTGGGPPEDLPEPLRGGYFMRPTVIADLPESSRCVQEEIFGPVVTISSFESEEEVLQKANGVKYGLSATVWTRDSEKARRVAEVLDVGTVWVNTWLQRDLRVPFGGTKHSGLGREGGWHSVDFFTEPTVLVIDKG